MSKPRSVKSYKNLPEEVKAEIFVKFPYGFDRQLITFKNPKGKFVTALPFESETAFYLIKMSRAEAQRIMLRQAEIEEMAEMQEDDSMDMVIEEIPESVVKMELNEDD